MCVTHKAGGFTHAAWMEMSVTEERGSQLSSLSSVGSDVAQFPYQAMMQLQRSLSPLCGEMVRMFIIVIYVVVCNFFVLVISWLK